MIFCQCLGEQAAAEAIVLAASAYIYTFKTTCISGLIDILVLFSRVQMSARHTTD